MTAGGLRSWLGSCSSRPRFLALAAFLFAGDLKADPRLAWLPVDLTLLTGSLLSGVLVLRWARGARLRSLQPLVLLGGWYLTFLPGLAQVAPTDYAFQKVATLGTFTLLSALAPLFLVQDRADLARLANALAYFCLAITLAGLLGGVRSDQTVERLQAFGAGTISLGRATGFLFFRAAAALGEGAPWPGLNAGFLALAGVTALFSGARGPILAALAVLVLLFALGRGRSGRSLRPLLGAGLLFLGVLAAVLPLAPRGSLLRVEAFLSGRFGNSEAYRLNALQESWRLVGTAPWGVGWGGFATQVDPERGVGRQYPHNLMAEVTLESGWACGAATLLVLVAAAVAAWSRTGSPGGRLVFAGLLFYAINAMVSGDLNDNRPLFMFLGSAFLGLDLRPEEAT